MRKMGQAAIGLRETDFHAGPGGALCRITASARSRNSRAEVLKSAVAGSRTVMYRSGRINFKMLFDSMITFRVCSSFLRKVGRASARRPCSVRTQNTGAAPADKNREVSDSPERSCSSEIAQE